MAEKRTIDINIKNNADEATKDFNHFNDALDETAKSAKNVNSTFEEVYGELQPLTTRLGEAEDRLYELALAGDTTSKEYQELLTKVGEYRKVQIQTDLAVDGAATTLTQKLGSALNGATSGFAATQGAIALFGEENEALEKSLLKVQSALAIQQGVDGLRTSYKELGSATGIATKAQAALNFVINLNPFVLITTAIVAAIAALATFTSALDPVIDKLKQFTDFIGITNFKEKERAEARKKRAAAQQKRIAAERKAQEEAYKERLKQIQETSKAEQVAFDRSIRLLESQGKNTIRLRKQRLKQELDEAKQRLELEKRTGGFLVSLYQNLVTERQIAYNDILKEQREFYKQQRDNAKQDEEKRQKEAQEALDSEIDAEIQLLAELDKIRQENEARFRTDEENELNAVAEKYDVLEAMAYGNAEALNEIEIARLNEENEIKAKFATEAYEAQKALDDKAEEDRKAREEKEIADAKAAQQAKIQFANDAFGAIGELANAFAGESEKSQKRAFQINKAVGIAQAIINTAGAVSAAINPAVGGLGIPAGLPGAALAAATGAAQIATIAKTKFQGGSSGDVSAPSEAGLGEAVSPQFNVVGESGVNQLAQLQQQPTQAYVVSGDVTSAQALDRNRVENATL